jgi:hypothetical protein
MVREKGSEGLPGMAKANVQAVTKTQKELAGAFEETNRYWLTRAKSGADLASDLVAKLGAAQSLPDATAVYQEWLEQRMQRFAEDSQKFVDECQKLTSAWTNLASIGALKGSW